MEKRSVALRKLTAFGRIGKHYRKKRHRVDQRGHEVYIFCPNCKEWFFSRRKSTSIKLPTYCKGCRKIYRELYYYDTEKPLRELAKKF